MVLLELGVIVGTRLGLGVFMKGVSYRVSYTFSNTVSARKPSLPLPSFMFNDLLYNIYGIFGPPECRRLAS